MVLTRRLCIAALFVTAAIHVAVVPEHLHEWPLAGAFFVALAAVEAALAFGVRGAMSTRFAVAGFAISAATLALWVVSRTVGLPFGPEAGTPEAVSTLDVASTVLEFGTAALFVALLRVARPRHALAMARVR